MLPKHVIRHHVRRLSPEIKRYEPLTFEKWIENFKKVGCSRAFATKTLLQMNEVEFR